MNRAVTVLVFAALSALCIAGAWVLSHLGGTALWILAVPAGLLTGMAFTLAGLAGQTLVGREPPSE